LDRFEGMSLAFHRSLREEFLAIARAEPERCAIVDASKDVQAVADRIWAIVRARFKL
jgi:dTMP kinase